MDDLASDFDIAWKLALEWFFEPFQEFFFGELHAAVDWSREPEFLDKELQKIVPEAEAGRGAVDKLVKLWLKDGAETILFVHVEVQSQHEANFARRIYAYNHRIEDRYGVMPVSLTILGDDGPAWRPSTHEAGGWGCEVRFTFPVVKLLDYRVREEWLEANNNPFAAVVLGHLKAIETRGDRDSRFRWKLRLIKSLYDRGLTQFQIRQLFNLIDWVMKLTPGDKARLIHEIDSFEKERNVEPMCPTFQYIRNEGLAEGRNEGLRHAIGLGLRRRFGQRGFDLIPRVELVTDAAALERLIDVVETAPELQVVESLLPQA